jgi:hypothetical protein
MTMTDYSRLLDKLREQRARPGWRPEEDRVLLEEADAIFETLSEADQEAARLQSPRAFPDSYLVENVDPDRDMGRVSERKPRSTEEFWQHVRSVSEAASSWPEWKKNLTIGARPLR